MHILKAPCTGDGSCVCGKKCKFRRSRRLTVSGGVAKRQWCFELSEIHNPGCSAAPAEEINARREETAVAGDEISWRSANSLFPSFSRGMDSLIAVFWARINAGIHPLTHGRLSVQPGYCPVLISMTLARDRRSGEYPANWWRLMAGNVNVNRNYPKKVLFFRRWGEGVKFDDNNVFFLVFIFLDIFNER